MVKQVTFIFKYVRLLKLFQYSCGERKGLLNWYERIKTFAKKVFNWIKLK